MDQIHYAGLGSRTTPPETLNLIQRLARRCAELGYVLRSGADIGAEQAFERGCTDAGGTSEIWLPRLAFQQHESQLVPCSEAFSLAQEHHPFWDKLSASQRAAHARKCHEILGADLKSPVNFMVCWTKDGCESREACGSETGDTATAIRIASSFGIPIFNLANLDAMERLRVHVESLKARAQEHQERAAEVSTDGNPKYDEFILAILDIFNGEVLSYREKAKQ